MEELSSIDGKIPLKFEVFLKENSFYNKYWSNVELGDVQDSKEIFEDGYEQFVYGAFVFEKTKEGKEFWERVHREWIKYATEKVDLSNVRVRTGMAIPMSYIGKKFGRWFVESRDKRSVSYYHCVCECGVRKVVYKSNLTNGSTQSCGCLLQDVLTKRREEMRR